MKMKKIIVIIIALALFLSAMTACQENVADENPELTETPTNVKIPAKMPELPDMKLLEQKLHLSIERAKNKFIQKEIENE